VKIPAFPHQHDFPLNTVKQPRRQFKMISRRRESVKVLAVRVLDEVARIKEYHKLLDIAEDAPEKSELLVQCYQTLSCPHWEELERSLSELEEQIRQLP
jgi:hypothetical protein